MWEKHFAGSRYRDDEREGKNKANKIRYESK